VSVKAKSRKTESCEFCNGKHYSEKARLRCYKANRGPECECKDYWATKWYSHSPDCPLRGEFRSELRPKVEKPKTAGPTKSVRRKA
jgi:hypothetical protein